MKTGIFYLFDNNNIQSLKTSLYFLFKHFNHVFKHNVYIMFRYGEMSKQLQDELTMNIRENSRNLLNFMELPQNIFDIPTNIDKETLRRAINANPTVDWGNIDERLLNYFWGIRFWTIVKDFDYIMKLDNDLFIEEPIREDFFKIMKEKGYNMMFNMLKSDCPIANFGFKEVLEQKYPSKSSEISQFFSQSTITEYNAIESFKNIYKIANKSEYKKPDVNIFQPIVCQDCFYITKVDFWNDSNTQELLNIIDRMGFIFYYKWSISCIVSLIPMAYDKDKLTRCVFKMSKEFHRTSLKDINNNVITKMPLSYELSGCITSK